MAGTGRNAPCVCGSGVKAKRCCGVARGPSEEQLAKAYLHRQAVGWAPLLIDHTDGDLDASLHEVTQLADRSLTLHVRLPRFWPPAIERLHRALADEDRGALAAALPDAVAAVDTPMERARLARALIQLHDEGHQVDCTLAAYAILDLAENGRSVTLTGALLRTLAVATGTARTPSGLLVASR